MFSLLNSLDLAPKTRNASDGRPKMLRGCVNGLTGSATANAKRNVIGSKTNRDEHEFPETGTFRCIATDHALGSSSRLVCSSDRSSCCSFYLGSCQSLRKIRGAASREHFYSCVDFLCTHSSLSVQSRWRAPGNCSVHRLCLDHHCYRK
jgi:hypothetical protein